MSGKVASLRLLTVFNGRGRQNSALPGLTTYIDKDERKLNMDLVCRSQSSVTTGQQWLELQKKVLGSIERQLMHTVGDKEEEGGTEKQVNIRWKTPSTALNSGELKFYSTFTLPC